MKWLIAVAASLVSCVASSPREYRQGLPVAPRPAPPYSPARAAPITVGQPGMAPPSNYPRSPPGRVLPESPASRREPGLWGSEPPQGSMWHGFPRLLDVAIPIPSEAAEDPHYLRIVNGCVYLIGMALGETDLYRQASELDLPARRCLVARLQLHCSEGIEKHLREKSSPLLASQQRAREEDEKFRREACRGVKPDDFPDHIFGMVSRRWSRDFERVQQ
jgi:hypothetical protein